MHLGAKLEIDEHYRDLTAADHEDDKHEKEEPEKVIELSFPYRLSVNRKRILYCISMRTHTFTCLSICIIKHKFYNIGLNP